MAKVEHEFWKSRGVDRDAPMNKTLIRRTSFEQKNREHEEFHRLFALWKAKN